MNILCLDLEGVLVPEIWQAVAKHTGIPALKKTTRDIPVYDDLMRARLAILHEHALSLDTIQDVIAGLAPLAGAVDFLSWARCRFQIAILSDTFYEFGMPLMEKLGHPLLLCHRLVVEGGLIVDYRLRQEDPKRQAVRAFHAMNYRVIAAGDSYNDVAMLEEADTGIFFDAPGGVIAQYPDFQAVSGYDELAAALEPLAEV
ncbi:MAG: bifunctional phosphoserine phosphatase/homoserine phosphotransferase ThrH [Gammaproteobacteria bacterium]|nr:bifunctional phosphoserine phosphatase/homoserine phosphotransferase ThrH [Gammaproteobacteria bacterium]